MVDYQVTIDRENGRLIVKGSFAPDSFPIEIPLDNPDRKEFIDLFLHKADIEKGIDFLRCISIDKDITVNEGLFVAGLNNCIKCFKFSASRKKLEKDSVFSDNEKMLQQFIDFETIRDKHFDHDENGMLQAIAFLLIRDNPEHIFGGPPSVVWNRVMFDYYLAGQRLQETMQFIHIHLSKQIDEVGKRIENYYNEYSYETLSNYKAAEIKLASATSERK